MGRSASHAAVGMAEAEIALLVGGLFLGVGAHLRSSQRDHDFRAKIKFLPLIRSRSHRESIGPLLA